jgi:NADP-dependent 3-hydroxy acid dehydrogenase YdfG
MAGDLAGTVAMVTGASSGIGAATARELAANGATVALVARRGDRLAALTGQITAEGGTALAVPADVTDSGQVHDATEQTVSALGRLDILISNAGAAFAGPVLDGTIEEWEQMTRLNLLGSLYCARAALPHLLRAAETGPREVADLVNISSLGSRTPRVGSAVYSATKNAVNAYTEALRQEVADRRVRVSIVEPATVDTELFPPEVRERRQAERGYPPVRAEDVAEAIGYLVTRPARTAISQLLIRPTRQPR